MSLSQLSRPYQIALCGVLALGLIWMVALRSHGASPSQPAPASAPSSAPTSAPASTTASEPSTSPAAEAKAAAAPTPVYHGAAPGVEGLTRAIAKAHGAVALSQRKAAQLQSKSAQASGEASAPATAGANGSVRVSRTSTTTAVTVHKRAPAAKGPAPSAPKSHARPAQRVVEQELAQGKTVILMFWNPSSAVDANVRTQVDALAHGSKGTIVAHEARADQVGAFGPITEVAHVYQTPTILIVNRHGVVSTLTGLTDVFALQQAVREAKRANS